MRLYWTPSQEASGAKASGKYLPHTETISLPEEFWSDLKQIFGLLIQSRLAELTFDQPGHYVADKLAPLIEQVRALVQKSEGVWNSETLAGVRFSLANALQIEGEQAGDQELFAEVIELYRKVFDEWTRERVPRNWAATQINLGYALWHRGRAESGAETLTEAVDAYRETLKEWTRERAPLNWAMTQNNLGTALSISANARAARRDSRGGRRLSGSAEGTDPRARAARLGNDTEQSRHCALSISANARAARRGSRRRSPPFARR